MFIRAYLRASTKEQDASRAKDSLIAFADTYDKKIASFYVENESGSTLERPELMRLIQDAGEGDIILVEGVDRLARLKQEDWDTLKTLLAAKKLLIVSPELPTSYGAMTAGNTVDAFTSSILQAVNGMLLDMLAAVARKDYEDRRRRQQQGIATAKAKGKYSGKGIDKEKHASILALLAKGAGVRETARLLGVSTSTVIRARDMAAVTPA